MADAIVTSEMRMDNRQFLDAAKNSTHELRKVKAESRELAREIGGANNVANGLASIMSGNLSQGLASVSSGLANLAPKLMAALGPIGLIIAGVYAAVRVFQKLQEVTNKAVDAIVNYETRSQRAARAEADREFNAMMARQIRLRRTREIEDETRKMAEQRLEGIAAMEAAHAREVAQLERDIRAEKDASAKEALRSRMTVLQDMYQSDVAAFMDAERKKEEAFIAAEKAKQEAMEEATRNRTAQIADENERMRIAAMEGAEKIAAEYDRRLQQVFEQMEAPETTEEQRVLLQQRSAMLSDARQKALDEATAQPVEQAAPETKVQFKADQLATVGGFAGGERMGLNIASKAEQLQSENNQILKRNIAAVDELTTQVQSLAASMTGGVI